jgi:general secretion pathway protein L
MTSVASFSSVAAGFAKGRELLERFGQWWLREFLDLFPQRVAHWLVDSGARALVLAPEANAVVLHLETDRGRQLASSRISRDASASSRIDEFLRIHKQSRTLVSIGLRLSDELIFCRRFAVPLATRSMLESVIVQDLLAKTPFRLDDIHHGHRVTRAGNRLVVSQSVIRRAHVVAEAEALGLEPDEIRFIEPFRREAGDAHSRILIRRPSTGNQNRWVLRLAIGLAVSASLLAGTGLGFRYYRQQDILDDLHSEITGATAKAKKVLSTIEKLQQEQAIILSVRGKRDEPGLLDLWEEATRALPTHTWLSELRLSETPDGRQVVMTGHSAAAASLIGLLDRSALFTDASLVGPIAVDPTEGRERFILQAKLKSTAFSKPPSR